MTRLATERIYCTADGRYCSETDLAVAVLVCAVGQPLPDDYEPAEKVDPGEVAEKVEGAPVPKKVRKGA